MLSKESTASIEPFVYRSTGNHDASTPELPFEANSPAPTAPVLPVIAQVSESEAGQRERRGYERGLQEGSAQAEAAFAQRLVQAQTISAQMAAEFERERAGFFRRVEGEVVRLALAIAKKILHREAQVDPLLLAGVARVALEQIAAGTVVRIRVHPEQIAAWREFFSSQSGLNLKLEWMGDATLDPAQCRVETSVGSTNLSFDDQLGEIAQGFFDLLAEKPGASA